MNYTETVRTAIIKGNYEARIITEYSSNIAIFYKKKYLKTVSTKQQARNFLDTVNGQ